MPKGRPKGSKNLPKDPNAPVVPRKPYGSCKPCKRNLRHDTTPKPDARLNHRAKIEERCPNSNMRSTVAEFPCWLNAYNQREAGVFSLKQTCISRTNPDNSTRFYQCYRGGRPSVPNPNVPPEKRRTKELEFPRYTACPAKLTAYKFDQEIFVIREHDHNHADGLYIADALERAKRKDNKRRGIPNPRSKPTPKKKAKSTTTTPAKKKDPRMSLSAATEPTEQSIMQDHSSPSSSSAPETPDTSMREAMAMDGYDFEPAGHRDTDSIQLELLRAAFS